MTQPLKATRPSWDETWLKVAHVIAARSLCTRDQVGAVIVDVNNRIVATGYNNPPSGFQHKDQLCSSWCERANAKRTWQSPDGAPVAPLNVTTTGDGILIDEDTHSVISDPYLFFTSRGYVQVAELSPCYDDCSALHAEANAISVCDRAQREGGTLYTTSHVCYSCAKLVANSGLSTVVVSTELYAAEHRLPGRSYDFLISCGLTVIVT